jgi:hypothetical protein
VIGQGSFRAIFRHFQETGIFKCLGFGDLSGSEVGDFWEIGERIYILILYFGS